MPQTAIKYGSLVFQEKLDSFANKLPVPSATWSDIWQQQHARAFMVAGAMRDELLVDLQRAVNKGINGEFTLEDFRKSFDDIVAKHNWSYNGGRNWRTRVIYNTNLRMAYAAGRYRQMQQLKRTRPFWQYMHSDAVANPRIQHLGWHGMVLAADDPWWQTHYPPNGWGCDCYVITRSAADLKRLGLKVGQAPSVQWRTEIVGAKGFERTVQVADGIDAGFAYNAGQAAWGQQLNDKTMQAFKSSGAKQWQPIELIDFKQLERPQRVPLDQPKTDLTSRNLSAPEMALYLQEVMQAEEKVFDVKGLPVLVNAKALAEHIDPNRSEYLPLLIEALEDPFEVWLNFDQHQATGKVALRTRVFKAFDIGKGKVVMITAQVNKGNLEAWTMIPMDKTKAGYINKQRIGRLVWGREE